MAVLVKMALLQKNGKAGILRRRSNIYCLVWGLISICYIGTMTIVMKIVLLLVVRKRMLEKTINVEIIVRFVIIATVDQFVAGQIYQDNNLSPI